MRYRVSATLVDEPTADRFVAWMREEHGAAILAAPGCEEYRVYRVDARRVDCEYLFATQAALDDYLRDRAPALRARGRELFPEGSAEYGRDVAPLVAGGAQAAGIRDHLILYVADQARAADFYRQVLAAAPRLDVAGMTEFALPGGAVLGLMPEAGIKRLLGDMIVDPATAGGAPRAELYLTVRDAAAHLARAVAAGGRLLSAMEHRGWGDDAGYCADLDGHVLAFAELN